MSLHSYWNIDFKANATLHYMQLELTYNRKKKKKHYKNQKANIKITKTKKLQKLTKRHAQRLNSTIVSEIKSTINNLYARTSDSSQ